MPDKPQERRSYGMQSIEDLYELEDYLLRTLSSVEKANPKASYRFGPIDLPPPEVSKITGRDALYTLAKAVKQARLNLKYLYARTGILKGKSAAFYAQKYEEMIFDHVVERELADLEEYGELSAGGFPEHKRDVIKCVKAAREEISEILCGADGALHIADVCWVETELLFCLEYGKWGVGEALCLLAGVDPDFTTHQMGHLSYQKHGALSINSNALLDIKRYKKLEEMNKLLDLDVNDAGLMAGMIDTARERHCRYGNTLNRETPEWDDDYKLQDKPPYIWIDWAKKHDLDVPWLSWAEEHMQERIWPTKESG